jgi:hypothetical protein
MTLVGNSGNRGSIAYYGEYYIPVNDLIATMYKCNFGFWASATNEDENAGIAFNMWYEPSGYDDDGNAPLPGANGMFWWKPFSTLSVQVGTSFPVGYFQGPFWTSWGQHSNNSPAYAQFWWFNGFPGTVLPAAFGFYTSGFGGSFSDNPAYLMIFTPSELMNDKLGELKLSLGFSSIGGIGGYQANRLGLNDANDLVTSWEHFHAQITYNIFEVGRVTFSYVNAPGLDSRGARDFFLEWDMSFLGIDMELGVFYRMLKDKMPPTKDLGGGQAIDYKYPIGIGLGFHKGSPWSDDPIMTNIRFGVSIPLESGDLPDDVKLYNKDTRLANIYYPVAAADVLIMINLSDSLRLYLPFGVGMVFTKEETVDDNGDKAPFLLGAGFSPYIVKKVGGVDLSAGFRLYNGNADPIWWNDIAGPVLSLNPDNMKNVRWALSVGMGFGF